MFLCTRPTRSVFIFYCWPCVLRSSVDCRHGHPFASHRDFYFVNFIIIPIKFLHLIILSYTNKLNSSNVLLALFILSHQPFSPEAPNPRHTPCERSPKSSFLISVRPFCRPSSNPDNGGQGESTPEQCRVRVVKRIQRAVAVRVVGRRSGTWCWGAVTAANSGNGF